MKEEEPKKPTRQSPMDNPLISEAQEELFKKYEEISKEYEYLNRTYFKNLLKDFVKADIPTKSKLSYGTILTRLACMISDTIYQRCGLSDLLFVSTASLLKVLTEAKNKDHTYVEACIDVYKLIIKPHGKEFKQYQDEVLYRNRPLMTEEILRLTPESKVNWKDYEDKDAFRQSHKVSTTEDIFSSFKGKSSPNKEALKDEEKEQEGNPQDGLVFSSKPTKEKGLEFNKKSQIEEDNEIEEKEIFLGDI